MLLQPVETLSSCGSWFPLIAQSVQLVLNSPVLSQTCLLHCNPGSKIKHVTLHNQMSSYKGVKLFCQFS